MSLAACTAVAQTERPDNGVELADDLRTVIILAGYQCKKVSKIAQINQSEFRVSCETDKQYLVRVNEEKELVVESRSEPSKLTAQTDTEHDAFMKKQLSAIVNLAGHDCGNVASYERHGEKGNIVTCQDQTMFRIYVTPEGRVAVERRQVDK
ncbi:MAG TPA: hypothetical protein VIR79_06825 [Nitrospira sp.]